jgi:hypothetical protein
MDLEKRIAELVKNGYTKNQAYLIATTTANKQYAQQAIDYNQQYMAMTPEQEQLKSGQFNGYRYGTQAPNFTFNPQMPTPQNPFENSGYANYAQTLEQNNPLPQSDFRGFQQYNTLDPNFKPSNVLKPLPQSTTSGSGVDTTQPNEVNIYNPFSGVSLDDSLRYAGQGFGEKDPWKAGIGTSLSLLKGARGFMSGYANGKESRRVAKQNQDTLYEQNRNYVYQQQGGKITNAENLTGQFIGDNPQGNVNAENGEFMKKYGNIPQEIVGDPHTKNGKKYHGTDVVAEEGDKFLSNTKILPIGAKNAKELKDRYNISINPKSTFAYALSQFDKKVSYKKETEELASWIEKFGDNEKLKDKTTKDLNAPIIEKSMLAAKSKIDALNEVRGMVFEDLYNRQEQIPKKGNPGDLFTDSGKLVTEKNEGVAQQGGEQGVDQVMQMVMQALEEGQAPDQVITALIQQGIPHEQAMQVVQQVMQQSQTPQNEVPQQEEMTAQQGGLMEMASKYGISNERAQELINLQQGGEKEYAQQAKSGYSFSTRYIPKSDKYDTEGSSILDQDILSGVEDFQNYTGKGYGAKMESVDKTIDTHKWYFDTEEKKKAFKEAVTKEGRQPEVVAFQEAYNKELEKRAESVGVPKSEIDDIKKQVGFSDKGVEKVDGLFGAFTSTRPLYNFSKKDGKVEVVPQNQTEETATQPIVDENGVKTYMPSFPVDLRIPPSALAALNKPYVPFGRIDPIKATAEPMLAEQERLRQADLERLNQTGLSPQQMDALSASGLASSQMAANDAIGKVENFNAQNQFQTDQFNLQQRTKEDVSNAQFSQKYQDQMLGSMDAYERNWRNYYIEGNLQNRMNYNDVENANLLNAKNEQYAVVPGQGVIFKNNQSQNLAIPPSISQDAWDKLTPQQQFDFLKNQNMANKKKSYLT